MSEEPKKKTANAITTTYVEIKESAKRVPLTFHEQARVFVKTYQVCKSKSDKEELLQMLADADLAVLEELLKIIIDQEHWITDVKGILKHG